jgi:hypothetical protein
MPEGIAWCQGSPGAGGARHLGSFLGTWHRGSPGASTRWCQALRLSPWYLAPRVLPRLQAALAVSSSPRALRVPITTGRSAFAVSASRSRPLARDTSLRAAGSPGARHLGSFLGTWHGGPSQLRVWSDLRFRPPISASLTTARCLFTSFPLLAQPVALCDDRSRIGTRLHEPLYLIAQFTSREELV